MKSPGQETYEGTEGKSTESSKHIGSFINSTIGCNWHLITKNENVQYRQAGRSGIPVKKVDTNNTTSTQFFFAPQLNSITILDHNHYSSSFTKFYLKVPFL